MKISDRDREPLEEIKSEIFWSFSETVARIEHVNTKFIFSETSKGFCANLEFEVTLLWSDIQVRAGLWGWPGVWKVVSMGGNMKM